MLAVSYFAMILCIVLGVGRIFKHKDMTSLSAASFMCLMAALIGRNTAIMEDQSFDSLVPNFATTIIIPALGPLLAAQFSGLLGRTISNRRLFLQLLPAAIILVTIAMVDVATPLAYDDVWGDFSTSPFAKLFLVFFVFSNIYFLYFIIRLVSSLWAGLSAKTPWSRALIGFLVLTGIFLVSNLVLKTIIVPVNAEFTESFYSFWVFPGPAVIITVAFLISQRYPYVMMLLAEEVRKKRRTMLSNVDTEQVTRRLAELIEEKVFCDEDLTLPILANMLDMNPHQLSEFLNDKMGQGFNAFINAHRVKETVRIIADEPQRSLLSVALAAGFNSLPAFNRWFRREMGMTPSQYKAQRLTEFK